MYQKDYILRMIEMFGEMLAGIFGLIRKRRYEQASQAIKNTYVELLRKNASDILKVDANKLPETLQRDFNFNQQQLEIVAGLLYAEAELNYRQKNFQDSKSNFQKSLTIFKYLDAEQKTYSMERLNRISDIEKRISGISRKNSPIK
jgi:hypothetical protein